MRLLRTIKEVGKSWRSINEAADGGRRFFVLSILLKAKMET
jgi:hypothetical protein